MDLYAAKQALKRDLNVPTDPLNLAFAGLKTPSNLHGHTLQRKIKHMHAMQWAALLCCCCCTSSIPCVLLNCTKLGWVFSVAPLQPVRKVLIRPRNTPRFEPQRVKFGCLELLSGRGRSTKYLSTRTTTFYLIVLVPQKKKERKK